MVKVTDLPQIFRPALPPFQLPDHAGKTPNLFLLSAETCGVIFGSLHPQTGGQEQALLGSVRA